MPASHPLDREKEGAALLPRASSLLQLRGELVVSMAYAIVAARAGLFALSLCYILFTLGWGEGKWRVCKTPGVRGAGRNRK